MSWPHGPWTADGLLMLAGAGVFAGYAGYVWRHRAASAAASLTVVLAATAQWSLAYALELSADTLATRQLWGDLKYLGICLLPPAWLAFVARYTGRATARTGLPQPQERGAWPGPKPSVWPRARRRWMMALLAVEPVAVWLLLANSTTHNLLRFYPAGAPASAAAARAEAAGAGTAVAWPPPVRVGPLFWVHLAYIDLMLWGATAVLLVSLWRTSRHYRTQSLVLLASLLLPWAANLLFNLGFGVFGRIDPTPFLFTLTGLVLVWGVFRFHLLNLQPIARGRIFATLTDAVVVIDPYGRIVDANPAGGRLCGLPVAQAIGQPLDRLLPAWAAAARTQAALPQHAGTHRQRVARQWGAWPWARQQRPPAHTATAPTAAGAGGRPRPWPGDQAVFDITMDATIDPGVGAAGGDSSPDAAGATTGEANGGARNGVVGAHTAAESGPDAAAMAAPRIRPATGPRIAPLTFELTITALDDRRGDPAGQLLVARDVTDRRTAERQLRTSLAREQDATEQLRAADELKSAFLRSVSHDLRTPLTTVLGVALTLRRGHAQLPAVEVDDLLDRLVAKARRLDRILGDLLDLEQLTRGTAELRRQPVKLDVLVSQLVEEATAAGEPLAGRPVSVAVAGGQLQVLVDSAKVERIVENLLANAGRHTPAGTPVWVRVQPLPAPLEQPARAADEGAGSADNGSPANDRPAHNGDPSDAPAPRPHAEGAVPAEPAGVLLVVEDAGPGVPADLRKVIFEPFRQGPSPAGHAPGVGIGLSLVAHLAKLHGGHAWVDQRPGGGARFQVLLSTSIPQSTIPPLPAQLPGAEAGMAAAARPPGQRPGAGAGAGDSDHRGHDLRGQQRPEQRLGRGQTDAEHLHDHP